MDAAEIGRRLQAARALAGIERRTLAKALAIPGLGEKTLGAVERGEREMKPHEVAPIAARLGVTPAFFAVDFATLGEDSAAEDLAGALNKLLQRVSHIDNGQDDITRQLGETDRRLQRLEAGQAHLRQLLVSVLLQLDANLSDVNLDLGNAQDPQAQSAASAP